ncbi:prepilin peptidase [Candidatus Nomurabacteria bacterium]|jgi:prepilin signal peptidase PulO-like enzyme (type II secretory pathway)|nr:MAG: prepilin peptidase [Candidatus Nomurabacteria bacterium]
MLLYYFALFILGTLIGSFLNVVIYRFQTGKGLGGRSMCMSCGKTLHWYELLPIVSFVIQHRRCTKCKSKIAWQYPIVEAITGLVFVALAAKYYMPGATLWQFLAPLLFAVFCMCLLIVISVYDLKHMIIPNRLCYLFIALTFLNLFISPAGITVPELWHLLGGILLPLPFFLLWYFSDGKLMGFGDIKLMIGIGFLLGIAMGIAALMIAFWSGALVAIVLLFFRKKRYTMKSEVPFGPFLVLGTFIMYAFGTCLVQLFPYFSL